MMKLAKEKGITLIALVVTIIIMLILAGLALNLVLGRYGLISKAKDAKKMQEIAEERERLELVLHDARVEREVNTDYNENEFLNHFIEEKITTAKINENNENENEVKVKKYSFLIDRQKLIIVSEIENDPPEEPTPEEPTPEEPTPEEPTPEEPTESQGLIQKIAKINASGNYEVEIKGKKEDSSEEIKTYNINLITYDGNLKLDGTGSVNGATLNENVYEFGNKEADVATETENARNMVVLKVNGNLTIDEGITLTACKSDDGYGGPKGLLVYCTGTLTNKGTISMTARGAKAVGENVFLWSNLDGSYEYVPEAGALGGASITAYPYQDLNGNDGIRGEGRQTGGGGSGASCAGDCSGQTSVSGKGSSGTSYSGGTRRRCL